jgi:hypothetical protein
MLGPGWTGIIVIAQSRVYDGRPEGEIIMDAAIQFVVDNIAWIGPLLAVLVGGTIIASRINKQSGSSNRVDQSGASAKGDIVGRDKNHRD